MRGHTVRCLIASLVMAVSFVGMSSAATQDSDEPLSGAETDWVGVPPPEDCRVEPMTVDEFVDALETNMSESSGVALEFQVPSEDDLPAGEPANDEIIEGISATLWESTACLNGGDFASFLALMSPSGVQFFLLSILEALGRPPGPLTDEEIAQYEANITTMFAEAPEPYPLNERSSIDEIRNVLVLPDDRVLAVADGRIGDIDAIFAVFRADDDRWLIDAFGVIGQLPEIQF